MATAFLWVPSTDGQQRRQAMAGQESEEIRDIIQKRRWSEGEAGRVVSAYPASGKSLSSFAREYGVQPSRIGRWSARLQGPSEGGMRFHRVQLVGPEQLDLKPGRIGGWLGKGLRVRYLQGF